MSSCSAFWRSSPALRTDANDHVGAHAHRARRRRRPGYFELDVALRLGGVRVGVEHGLLRADQDVERIGDAVLVAIVGRARLRACAARRAAASARRDRRAAARARTGRPSASASPPSGYALRGKPSIESTSRRAWHRSRAVTRSGIERRGARAGPCRRGRRRCPCRRRRGRTLGRGRRGRVSARDRARPAKPAELRCA